MYNSGKFLPVSARLLINPPALRWGDLEGALEKAGLDVLYREELDRYVVRGITPLGIRLVSHLQLGIFFYEEKESCVIGTIIKIKNEQKKQPPNNHRDPIPI